VLVIVEAVEAQSSGAQSLAETTQGGSQSSGAHSLAGMMKTSTCVLHVTDREGGRETSTCVSQLTDRGGFCRGLPLTVWDGFCWSLLSLEIRRERDNQLLLELLGRLRGLGGICRIQDIATMLGGAWWMRASVGGKFL